ncbi:MAG: AAA family ATPase [Thermoguttaceae bacterium]|jgi:hypothetical protein
MNSIASAARPGAGRILAERLNMTILGSEGHDLKTPCVSCQSSDAARVHQDTGVFFCYACQKALSAWDLCKVVLGDHEAAKRLMVDVGLFQDLAAGSNGNGHASTPPAVTDDGKAAPSAADEAAFLEVCRLKRVPPDAWRQFGARPHKGGVVVPMYGPDRQVCSTIHITPKNGKGMYAKGKHVGLFLPGRFPAAGETWLIGEGPKDPGALVGLGYLAAGLPGNHLNEKFAPLFQDVDVVVVAHSDVGGKQGAAKSVQNLQGVARSVKVAHLPTKLGAHDETIALDVRDVFAEYGADAVHQAIRQAMPAGQDREPEDRIDFGIITAAELLRKDCSVEFLIPHVLAKGQHHILGGPLKCCKSLIATDLAVSLAMGGRFLDHFDVARPVRTILISGESGWPVFQENIRRISHARQATEEQLENLLTGVRLPKFGNVVHQDVLGDYIIDQKAEVVILDCAYRCIPGDKVSNQFAMGEVLDSIGNALESVGATLVLLCHTPKHVAAGEPLELDNLAFAGFSEFAAQWLIVNRRQRYEPGTGRHALWGVIGGRAGHSGTFAIDLDEGEFHQGEDREWRVAVARGDEARKEQQGQREKEREEKQAEKLESNRKRICNTAVKFPEGESKTIIRDRTGLRPEIFNPAWASLLDDGILVEIDIIKPNRKTPYVGYRLRDSEST